MHVLHFLFVMVFFPFIPSLILASFSLSLFLFSSLSLWLFVCVECCVRMVCVFCVLFNAKHVFLNLFSTREIRLWNLMVPLSLVCFATNNNHFKSHDKLFIL